MYLTTLIVLAGGTFSFRKLVVLVELAVNLGRDVLCNVPSAILGYVEAETSSRITLYNAAGLVGDPGMPGPGYMVQDVDKIFWQSCDITLISLQPLNLSIT